MNALVIVARRHDPRAVLRVSAGCALARQGSAEAVVFISFRSRGDDSAFESDFDSPFERHPIDIPLST